MACQIPILQLQYSRQGLVAAPFKRFETIKNAYTVADIKITGQIILHLMLDYLNSRII